MLNATIHSFTNELCAIASPPDEFAEWQGRAYLSKRASNCTMGFVQTLLFGIHPSLPFWVAGIALLSFSILSCVIYVSEGVSPLQLQHILRLLAVINAHLDADEAGRDPASGQGGTSGVVEIRTEVSACERVTTEGITEERRQSMNSSNTNISKVRVSHSTREHVSTQSTTQKRLRSMQLSQGGVRLSGGSSRASRVSLVQEAFIERMMQREQNAEDPKTDIGSSSLGSSAWVESFKYNIGTSLSRERGSCISIA